MAITPGDILISSECGEPGSDNETRWVFWQVVKVTPCGSRASVVRIQTVDFVNDDFVDFDGDSPTFRWVQQPVPETTTTRGTYYASCQRICAKHCDFISGEFCKFHVVEVSQNRSLDNMAKEAWTTNFMHTPRSLVMMR